MMALERACGFIIFRKLSGNIQYLLMQTSYGIHHWTPPKGHVESCENDLDTAYRETMEEAGILKEHLKVFKEMKIELNYLVKGRSKTTIYFLAELLNSETPVKLSHEHQDFKWLDFEETYKLAGFPDMQAGLQKCHDFLQQ